MPPRLRRYGSDRLGPSLAFDFDVCSRTYAGAFRDIGDQFPALMEAGYEAGGSFSTE